MASSFRVFDPQQSTINMGKARIKKVLEDLRSEAALNFFQSALISKAPEGHAAPTVGPSASSYCTIQRESLSMQLYVEKLVSSVEFLLQQVGELKITSLFSSDQASQAKADALTGERDALYKELNQLVGRLPPSERALFFWVEDLQ